jgi:hypothetical protein
MVQNDIRTLWRSNISAIIVGWTDGEIIFVGCTSIVRNIQAMFGGSRISSRDMPTGLCFVSWPVLCELACAL